MNVTGKCPFCFASYSFDDSQAGQGSACCQSLFHAVTIALAREDSSVLPVKPRVVSCCQSANVLRECPDELVARVPVPFQLKRENFGLPLSLAARLFRMARQLNGDLHKGWG